MWLHTPSFLELGFVLQLSRVRTLRGGFDLRGLRVFGGGVKLLDLVKQKLGGYILFTDCVFPDILDNDAFLGRL
jgi:hypothetical protein